MPEGENKVVSDPKEIAEEKTILSKSERNDDQIKEMLIKDYGLDAEADKDKLDKLVEREKHHNKRLSTAIKQKQTWRAKAQQEGSHPSNEQEKNDNKDDLSSVKDELTQTKQEITEFKFRQSHSHLADDEFNFVKTYAKGAGKSLEEAYKDETFQQVFQAFKRDRAARDRVERGTPSPSSRTKSGSLPDWQNMSPDEFQQKKREVLRRRGD